jgi:xylan 1,4-beta-xylosidase
MGRLTAVYKAGVEHYASINFSDAANWKPGTWHEAVFSWKSDNDDVNFYLEVDDKLSGKQTGKLIQDWPKKGYVGIRRNSQPWKGKIEKAHLSPVFSYPKELRPGRRTITINGDPGEQILHNFWSINNFTSQHMWADPKYPQQAKRDKPFMQYVNCVRLLGGRHDGLNNWFKGVGENGEVLCDFSGLIQYLSGIIEAGYTPRIVLDNIPTAMSEPGEMAKYGNTLPALDLNIWHAYIVKAIQAMVDAFGMDTVAGWRIRVGTEPDLYPGHWKGTKEEYLRHYDCTVDAVLSVIPNAEVGPGNILNPAKKDRVNGTGQIAWGLDIVDHCASGTNTWTGKTGTRMSFLECSWYGQVGRSIDSLDIAIQKMRDRLNRYPQFANLPISIAEFSILNDEYGHRCYGDITEWGASWYAAVADRVYDLEIEQVHEWAQATNGVLHPRTQVIAMLERMQGGERLAVNVKSESMAKAGAIACRKDGRYLVLLYNHRPWRTPSLPEKVDLVLQADALRQNKWFISEWGIGHNHGVFAHQFYADSEAAGLESLSDAPLYGGNVRLRYGPEGGVVFAQNRSRYIEMGKPVQLRKRELIVIQDGTIQLSLEMPGHSVRLLEVFPERDYSMK